MQRLIVLSNPRLAQAFVDYMATLGVQINTKTQGNDVELSLSNEALSDKAQLEWVQHELKQFLNHPMDKRYQAASWQTGKTNTDLNYSAGDSYWQTIRQKAGPLTLGVMALCILIYLFIWLVGAKNAMLWLGFPQDNKQAFEVWRWFTPAFMHFGIMHIAFNLVMWWYIGGSIELRQGSKKLLEITVLSILIANSAQYLSSGGNFGGLSGVVYALIGYAWLCGERDPQQGVRLDRPLMIFALIWLAMGYFDIVMPIANMAHFVGLLVGLALGWWKTRTVV